MRRHPPLPRELARRDREVGRGEGPLEHLLGVALGGHDDGDLAVGLVAGGEERQAVGVVPVQVAEEDRAREGVVAEVARSGCGAPSRRRGRGTAVRRRGPAPRTRCGPRSARSRLPGHTSTPGPRRTPRACRSFYRNGCRVAFISEWSWGLREWRDAVSARQVPHAGPALEAPTWAEIPPPAEPTGRPAPARFVRPVVVALVAAALWWRGHPLPAALLVAMALAAAALAVLRPQVS